MAIDNSITVDGDSKLMGKREMEVIPVNYIVSKESKIKDLFVSEKLPNTLVCKPDVGDFIKTSLGREVKVEKVILSNIQIDLDKWSWSNSKTYSISKFFPGLELIVSLNILEEGVKE